MRNFLIILICCLLTACYNDKQTREDNLHDALAEQDSTASADSISFYSTHHYSVGYNFIVHNDSLQLIVQQPEEKVSQLATDTFTIPHNQQLAVSDIRILPQDSIDSVWVQLVSERGRLGWIHETELLPAVVPTDPISQFIMFFSDSHILIAVIIMVLIGVAYMSRIIHRRNAPIVHFRDIPSFYPTLLCIIVAAAATFYASLQLFGTDIWRHFYYHPSLNPFTMPPILALFIISVWAMLIVGIAVVEDTRHLLPLEDALIYLLGLAGVCAVLYIVFSISTLYFVGYPLLVAYCYYAITTYQRHPHEQFMCGNCGKRLTAKGKCPYCGAIND